METYEIDKRLIRLEEKLNILITFSSKFDENVMERLDAVTLRLSAIEEGLKHEEQEVNKLKEKTQDLQLQVQKQSTWVRLAGIVSVAAITALIGRFIKG